MSLQYILAQCAIDVKSTKILTKMQLCLHSYSSAISAHHIIISYRESPSGRRIEFRQVKTDRGSPRGEHIEARQVKT